MSHYFTPDEIEKIKSASENHVLEVIRDFQDMEEKKGYDWRGVCPICHKPTFNYNSKKNLFGCFRSCNVGGTDALSYLMKVQQKTYVEALQYLADKFFVPLSEQDHKPVPNLPQKQSKVLKGASADCFCTRMLAASGLTYDDVTAHVFDVGKNKTITIVHTFSRGTVNSKGDIDLTGDDVIIK